MTLIKQIENIYQLLGDNRIEELGLFRTKNGKLVTPLGEDSLTMLYTYRSKRTDELIEQPAVEGLITAIKEGESFKGFNHIGFCYKVASKAAEVKRVARVAHSSGYSAYQEPSIDGAAWVFVGDITEITNPLLEFLPHEGQTDDEWMDYWLPHIQFDVDTGLSPGEIDVLVKKFIRKPFTPYPIKIDGVTYIQRVNLGCIEGVNLMLDIATNNRDIQYRKTWARLA
jgi:hypothetical protein